MKFEFSDAWLLQSIRYSEKDGNGATLTDIIAFADYSNHAIMTYPEFLNGAKNLINIGLIIELNKKLLTTENLREWWTKKFEGKRKIGIHKGLEEIEKYLNRVFKNIDKREIDIMVTRQNFQKATDNYLEWAN
jgi:hypothetical protein